MISNARAITVKQPWASLLACGAKPVENRTWPIPRTWPERGPLLIHAGASREKAILSLPSIQKDLGEELLLKGLPSSAVIAVAGTVTCHEALAGCCITPYARAWGWHWVLHDLRTLPEPVPASGRLGLWHPNEQLLAAIEKQLATKKG